MKDGAAGIPAHRAVAKNGHRATAWFEAHELDKVAPSRAFCCVARVRPYNGPRSASVPPKGNP